MGKRIIHFVMGKANPERMNGVNKVVHELSEAQYCLGYEVEIWGITQDVNAPKYPRPFRQVFFQDHSLKFILDSRLKKEIKSLDSQCIAHIHGGFIPQFYALTRLLKKQGVEYLFTPHGALNTVALERSQNQKRLYIALFESFVINNAKAIHCIGESEVHATKQQFPKVNTVLVPNGQKIEEEANSTKRSSIPKFGFIGRLDLHTKGLDLLLQSFSELVNTKGIEAELHLVGGGPDEARIKQLAQDLDIVNQMKLKGALFGEEKRNAIREFDFFVLTSRNEGMPGVVLETSAKGIPSIVSPETNLASYVNQYEAGIGLESNSVDHISNALEKATKVLNTPQYIQASANAITMVKQSFDWNGIAKKFQTIYES